MTPDLIMGGILFMAGLACAVIIYGMILLNSRANSRGINTKFGDLDDWVACEFPSRRIGRRQEILLAMERRLSQLPPPELERCARCLFQCPVEEIV